MLKKTILIITFLLFIVSTVKTADCIMGIGIFYGKNITDDYYPEWHSSPDYKWNNIIIHPVYGWALSNAWEVYFEGDIGYYNFQKMNAYSLGISLMTDYIILDPIYLELGCGIGYWTDSPHIHIIGRGLIGLIKYGTGIKFELYKNYIIKIGYRFTHSSDIFADDTGINTHGALISISKGF